MCTAISFRTKDHYFGRNLDLEYSYHETVTITPRNYPFRFRKERSLNEHYAIIGVAYVCDEYPLYYDGVNEMGLCAAGLNFPYYADYKEEAVVKSNIAPFEFIPWVLSQCENVSEAKALLEYTNILYEDFSESLTVTPLHWMISDKKTSIVVEPVKEGLKIYDNPVDVLTNSPTFDKQLYLSDYMKYLPGDFSSGSRFVKATYMKKNGICKDAEEKSISQFFHMLDGVAFPRGSVIRENEKSVITVYSSCANADKGIYYYKTYENNQITAIDMFEENLDSERIITYPLKKEQQICWQNK